MARLIKEIAREIRADWKNVYFGAVPYLEAMEELETIKDKYYFDDADTILRYFLANSNTWRGEVARRVKQEIKAMLR